MIHVDWSDGVATYQCTAIMQVIMSTAKLSLMAPMAGVSWGIVIRDSYFVEFCK